MTKAIVSFLFITCFSGLAPLVRQEIDDQRGRGCGVLVHDPVPRAGDDTHGHVRRHETQDRKSTRLNSSHSQISYAVFCLKKKKKKKKKKQIKKKKKKKKKKIKKKKKK